LVAGPATVAAVVLVAGFGATRAAVARVARVPVPRAADRVEAARFDPETPAGFALVGFVSGVGSGAVDSAGAGCSVEWFGAPDSAAEKATGGGTGDRPLPVSAERGAGVLRRLLVRVARRPFCPSTATTPLLPNAAASEAPTEMGDG